MSEVKVNKISPRTGTDIELNSTAKITNFTSTGIDDNATSTAVTVDSSGNVLVGTTTNTNSGQGINIRANGVIKAGATSSEALNLFRLSTDGNIVNLYKDGTTVGSIGTHDTDLVIGTGDTGLRFYDLGDAVLPNNPSTPANRDNAIDLGHPSIRFNDLYLGGNIYLGGTGSANALDDYETGTFTVGTNGDATGAFSNETGEYTKIGNVVHVRIVFTVSTNFTNDIIDGLPFVPDHATGSSAFLGTNAFLTLSNANGVIFGKIQDNNAELRFCENNDFDDAHSPNTVNSTYRISFWYYSV